MDYMAEIQKRLAADPSADVSDLVKARAVKITNEGTASQWGDSQAELERLYLNKDVPVVANAYNISAPTRRSGSDIATDYGYTQDYDTLYKRYLDVLDSAYQTSLSQQDAAERAYYNQMGAEANTLLDTLRSGYNAATATGASKGQLAASLISGSLGLGQSGSQGISDLIGNRTTMAQNLATAKAQASVDATSESNTIADAIAKIATDQYGYDMSGYVGNLGANSAYQAAVMGYLGQKGANESNLAAAALNASAYGGSGGSTSSDIFDQLSKLPGYSDLNTSQQQQLALALLSGASYADIQAMLKNLAGGSETPINNKITESLADYWSRINNDPMAKFFNFNPNAGGGTLGDLGTAITDTTSNANSWLLQNTDPNVLQLLFNSLTLPK